MSRSRMFSALGGRRVLSGVALLLAALLSQACGQEGAAQHEETRARRAIRRPTVYTVNYPLDYFARRIGGESVEVVFPAPAELDPAFWLPSPEEILSFQKADLILLNGADYAKWVKLATLPPEKLVDTSAAFQDSFIVIQNAMTHSHGPSGKHSHAGTVFTTWIDFTQAGAQAQAVYEAFLAGGLADSLTLRRNFEALREDLRALDDSLLALTRGQRKLPLLASHPIYQYFARRYAPNLVSVTWEPGEAPSEAQWEDLSSLQKEHGAAWMIWEGEPLPASRKRLSQMGIHSVVFDPCANRPPTGDFLDIMRQNLQDLRAIYRN